MTGEEALKKLQEQYSRQNQYNARKYDRLGTVFPQGTADRIKNLGYSLSGFLKDAVREKLSREEDILNTSEEEVFTEHEQKAHKVIRAEVDGEVVEVRLDANGRLMDKDIRDVEAYRLYLSAKRREHGEAHTEEIPEIEQKEGIPSISLDEIGAIVGQDVMEAIESKKKAVEEQG